MTWVGTNRGHKIDFVNPDVNEIDIYDLAEGLARSARFAGLTKSYYSVAEHCVRGSKIIDPKYALEFLLHDAPEAYMTDCPLPLKRLLGPAWTEIEDKLYAVIAAKFNLPSTISNEVKRLDFVMLVTEKRDLMPRSPKWEMTVPPCHSEVIVPWTMNQAQAAWLHRLKELCGVRGQAVA